MDSGRLVLEGSPETVFQKREIMESLGLGIPLVLDLFNTDLTVKESLKKWFSRG
jgi:cobalt/nickel transport system ATP-binding protein